MDVFNFCWVTLLIESKNHSVFLEKGDCKVENECDEEFDKPIKRISFWYKYACFNIYFFNRCLSNFIQSVPDSRMILEKICAIKNLNICSLSTGPGSYVIGFLYSLHLLGIPMSNTVDFKFISKHGHWRNLVRQMLNSRIVNVPESLSCKLIQCDVMTELSTKAQSYIKNADVLFMCNAFSSPRVNKDATLSVLKDILQLLKPGALVFFIATEETSSFLKEFSMFGHFLYEPNITTVENVPYDEKVAELIGVIPINSGSSYFAVWQKFDFILEEKPSPVKLINISSENLCEKTTNNMANIPIFKQDAFNLKSSSNFSSALLKVTSANNTPIQLENNVSLVNKSKEKTAAQTTCSNPTNLFNCKKEHCAQSVQTDIFNTNLKRESSEIPSTQAESSLKSLIKTVERLVTSLDDFVRSQNTYRSSSDQKDSICAGFLPNKHNEKVCQQNDFSGCACNRFHSSCIQSCISSNNSHCCNCFVSMNHKHQNIESEGPHLVVPLHNLNEQTLAQILSLASSSNNQ